jgi:ferredoxin
VTVAIAKTDRPEDGIIGMEGAGGPTNGKAVRMDVMKNVDVGDFVIDHGACDGCRQCVPACPVESLSFEERLEVDRSSCVRCFCRAGVCPVGALKKRFS